MPRRRHNNGNGNGNGNGHGFNLATVAQIGLIPLITGAVYIFAQWVTTGNVLASHEKAITETIPQQFREESKAREQNHQEFVDKLGKLNDQLGTLNTHAAVQDQSDKQIADTLERISRQLEGGALKPSRP